MTKTKKTRRRCKGCRAPEKITYHGGSKYTNIWPLLGYCADCVNRAMKEGKS